MSDKPIRGLRIVRADRLRDGGRLRVEVEAATFGREQFMRWQVRRGASVWRDVAGLSWWERREAFEEALFTA